MGLPAARPTPPVALTICGSDSGGGAGVAADLRSFAAHGVFGTFALTAVTAQNTRGVDRVEPLSPDLVTSQIDAVVSDLAPTAAKTGYLGSSAVAHLCCERAEAGALPAVVCDPVLVDAAARPLFRGDEMLVAYRRLFSSSLVATPNMAEAGLLSGGEVRTVAEMEEAAAALHLETGAIVVVTGGRLGDLEAVDVVYDGRSMSQLRGRRVETGNLHGSGCSFSAAVAARLARGDDPMVALFGAKSYVQRAIELSAGWRLGAGHGPLDHLGEGPLPIAGC